MAGIVTAEKEALAIEFGLDGTYAALFTADPGTSGTATGEVTGGSPAYARKALSWTAGSSDGVVTVTVTFDVPAGTTITHAAVCSSISGSTVLYSVDITDQAFATQGTYALTLTATVS
jgi:hypothetical protein